MPETWFDAAEAQWHVDFAAMLPATSDGKPIRLLPWQIEAISQFYGYMCETEEGTVRRLYQFLYLELTKKQGKTEIAAGLGIDHLLDEDELNGEIYIIAADKENAGICYNDVVFKIRNTPALAKLERKGVITIRESTRKVTYKKTGAVLRVLSADAQTKHGYKPSCVIFDELHAQPNRALWDVMTFGAGDARRQPVWIVLTTAGDDPDRSSIGWEVHQKALGIRDARQLRKLLDEGGDPMTLPALRQADPENLQAAIDALLDRDDPAWLPILYGLNAKFSDDEDLISACDIYDEDLWRELNPSIGVTVPLSTIRAEAKAARKDERQERLFRWLRLNQWIATKTVGWLPLTIYDKTQFNLDPDVLLGKRCYAGLDLSSTSDLTALALYFPQQAGLSTAVAMVHAWLPDSDIETRESHDHAAYRDWQRAGFMSLCPGDTIDYADVKSHIYEAKKLYKLQCLGTDPYLSRTITQELMDHKIPCVEIPQTIAGMWPAMWEMEQAIRKHLMLHVHNTALRYCFGNVRCRSDGNGNLKPMKNLSRGRIDMLIAWINAVAAALLDGGNEPTLADALATGAWTM